jgi:hypothetical protein
MNRDRNGNEAAMKTPKSTNSVCTATAGRIRGAPAARIEER